MNPRNMAINDLKIMAISLNEAAEIMTFIIIRIPNILSR